MTCEKLWKVVQDNMNLCYFVLRNMGIPEVKHEELVSSVGIPTLLKCAAKHNPDKSKFSTYAVRALVYGYKNEFRDSMKEEERRIRLYKHLKNKSRQYQPKIGIDLDLGVLNHFQRTLVHLRFFRGWSLKDISEVVGMTKSGVHWHFTQIYEQLYKSLNTP